jgi:hypothetical protein
MKAKKIVRYRMPVSVKFPAKHKRSGEPTNFVEKIKASRGLVQLNGFSKIHTIRANYDLWAKCFEKINKGEAVLELYYWSGKPYNSKSVTICQLGKDDGIGMQKIEFDPKEILKPFVEDVYINNVSFIDSELIAKNDGLSLDDFKEWFKGYDISKQMAIIHFTPFRY